MASQYIAGRYQAIAQISSTDHLTIYRAVDLQSGTTVRLQVIDGLAADARFATRFHRQAHLAGELSTPYVARVLDFGRYGDRYFVAEEWVDSVTLADYLKPHRRLSVVQALSIAAMAARGLEAAHARGLIHGGLTPLDLLITDTGEIKVSEITLARPLSAATLSETAYSRDAAYYISPEQAQGEAATTASDVYALGGVLYRMLAGRPPFEGAAPLTVALKHVNEDPPELRALRPEVPREVEALVMRCLSKQPALRFADGGALARAIEGSPHYRAGMLAIPLEGVHRGSFWERLTQPPVSWLALLALLLLLLTLGTALFALRAPSLFTSPTATVSTIPAPAFVELPLPRAEQLAAARQVTLSITDRVDPQGAPDTVVEQSPEAGEPVLPGGRVEVVVSRRPVETTVPNITGGDLGQAQRALAQAGLQPGQISERPAEPSEQGRVLEQKPPAGTHVARGAAVDLVIGAAQVNTATPAPPVATTTPIATPTAPGAAPSSPTPSPTPSPPTVTPSPSPSPSPAISSPTPAATPTPDATPTSASPTASPTTPASSPTASPADPTATPTAPAIVSPAPAGTASPGTSPAPS